ncbi:MAG: hypothetical protein CO093_04180 [Alphaproteobacteria bacterium CG_4_9_14_3_um_filter_47_13]|nr:MAG: hypothetical protein CO093_04180 [Alphaproteobacteria bacterium CG_4_9_14_3_um_filter_47_13]
MKTVKFQSIQDPMMLFCAASNFMERAERMPYKHDDVSPVDPQALLALVEVAETLGVIDSFSRSALGVSVLNDRQAIKAGERPLKHGEAVSTLRYIVNQTKPIIFT